MQNATTLKVPIEIREKVYEIKRRTGASSMTEVIKRSLSLYDEFTKELGGNNSRIVLQKLDGDGQVSEEVRVIIIK